MLYIHQSTMKKSFLFLCLSILALAGCKKESNELNRNAVNILVLPITDNGVSPIGYSYKLKAMVVSPAKVEVQDYGFLIIGGGSTSNAPIPISLGSGSIGGSIDANYDSPLPTGQFTVAAYAILKNGEIIYSEGYTPTTTPTASTKVEIATPGYTIAFPGYETFVGDIFNYDVTNYQVIEIGIDYATSADFSTNGGVYTNQYSQPYVGTQASPIPFFLQTGTSTIFSKSIPYNFRTYVNVLDLKTTNIFKVRDNTNDMLTFTAQ